jgi:hypothetical protein
MNRFFQHSNTPILQIKEIIVPTIQYPEAVILAQSGNPRIQRIPDIG